MEEDVGSKAAPMTRLRRRLSVESDDTKSPSAPSTPTKKRSTRLAAKPQLDLIDEHAVTNSPKRLTRKSISRDVVEPDEKAVTPARRSARSKSNTSLVSEAEEKPLTPARRNTRIKSNTSIVAETTQTTDSPRAKRAIARRNSQISSDTETTVTPSRTRRTRKASTSSIDKEETLNASETAVTPGRVRRTRKTSTSSIDTPAEAEKPSLISEVIPEEPETKRKSTNNTENVNSSNDSPMRKSPRLLAKYSRDGSSDDVSETTKQSEHVINSETQVVIEPTSQSDISISTANLIKELDKKLNKKSSNKNKSMSDIEGTLDSKKRNRTKSWTTLCSSSPPVEGNFYSDNESTKKKIKKYGKLFNDKRITDGFSGDGPKQKDENIVLNYSKLKTKTRNSTIANESGNFELCLSETPKKVDTSNESNKENLIVAPVAKNASLTELLFESAPSGDIKSTVFLEDSDSNTSSLGKGGKQHSEEQCVPVVLHKSVNELSYANTGNIFAWNTEHEKDSNDSVEPMDIDETMPENVSLTVISGEGKHSRKSSLCIQETGHSVTLNKSTSKPSVLHGDSQIHEKSRDDEMQHKAHKLVLSLTQNDESNNESTNKAKNKLSFSSSMLADDNKIENESELFNSQRMNESKKSRKSSIIIAQNSDSSLKDHNKSKRKSRLSHSVTQNEIDNKNSIDEVAHDSDLNILETNKSKRKSSLSNSQMHDLEKSINENKSTLVLSEIKDTSIENNVSKEPQNELSKSIISQADKPGLVNKNLTVNYLTSTPVHQKTKEKLAMQMNTSVITPTYEEKIDKQTPKFNATESSQNSEKESSDEDSDESSEDKSNLLDNEAEDAGEDYESGDSMDEDERQHEINNEIFDKGETLTSEDDISNDSDYEKNSFIVSSDEEDKELLSGSGDDLNMSDNELTFSSKSKIKYNKRKELEQKKASKEMYEARHGIKESEDQSKPKKKNRSRLDSSLLKSDEDMPPKKNKRMRLESTLETLESNNISTTSDVDQIGYKKKKSKRLSESVCNESIINEKEITIQPENTFQNQDPLSMQIKIEPKTPQKDLEISKVHVTDDVEQVDIDEDVSMMKTNETSDPLHMTIMQNSEDSVSENEEIANNYDSVLKELNKQNIRKIKSHDISLNLNKKDKQKTKKSIIDELNLTKSKISKKDVGLHAKEKSVKRVCKKLANTDDDDSIELKLLFSEESNDSDKGNDSDKNKYEEPGEIVIPLKKSEAQTNILSITDNKIADQSLNTSTKKKNKKGKISDKDVSCNGKDTQGFFIDTKGDLSDKEESNNGTRDESDSDAPPIDVLYVSEKACIIDSNDDTKTNSVLTKKKKNLSRTQELNVLEPGITTINTQFSEKKSQKSKSIEENILPESASKTPTSAKKKSKKISESQEITTGKDNTEQENATDINDETDTKSKKRKRKTSANQTNENIQSKDSEETSQELKETILGNKKKKLKISTSLDDTQTSNNNVQENAQPDKLDTSKKTKKSEAKQLSVQDSELQKVNRKRKVREDDEDRSTSKVSKEHSFDKVHVPRLPPGIIEQLEDKPKKDFKEKKKAKVVSTSNFIVEETKRRKNKPSDFLEESVYLNHHTDETVAKKKTNLKRPKVLPFMPTVSISDSGFTTNFHVKVLSPKIEFLAQRNDVPHFKDDYLNERKMKKLRTYDLYKKQRNVKLSKY